MDRLHTLGIFSSLFALVALCGCEEEKTAGQAAPANAPPGRFEAVTKKSEISEKDLDGFCDIRDRGAFHLPAISGGKEPSGARWVNVWATWCKSCVEEMPMIERWREEHGIQVLYVSADEERSALDTYLKDHPKTPSTTTMNEPGALTDWMKALGLDEGAGLPLHVFVRADNTVACARAAAVSEHHLSLVKNLLK
jgi:thiol-disulfide isomerase/thioredoxin